MSALREWMAERGQRSVVKVGFLGKLKTALQMVSTSLLLAACPGAADFSLQTSLGVSRTSMLTAGLLTLYMSTVLAMVSAAQYFAVAWPTLIAGEESEDGASSVVKKF